MEQQYIGIVKFKDKSRDDEVIAGVTTLGLISNKHLTDDNKELLGNFFNQSEVNYFKPDKFLEEIKTPHSIYSISSDSTTLLLNDVDIFSFKLIKL